MGTCYEKSLQAPDTFPHLIWRAFLILLPSVILVLWENFDRVAFDYFNRPAPLATTQRSLRSRKTSRTQYSDADASSSDGMASEEYESQSESWSANSDGSETVNKGQHLNVSDPIFHRESVFSGLIKEF